MTPHSPRTPRRPHSTLPPRNPARRPQPARRRSPSLSRNAPLRPRYPLHQLQRLSNRDNKESPACAPVANCSITSIPASLRRTRTANIDREKASAATFHTLFFRKAGRSSSPTKTTAPAKERVPPPDAALSPRCRYPNPKRMRIDWENLAQFFSNPSDTSLANASGSGSLAKQFHSKIATAIAR